MALTREHDRWESRLRDGHPAAQSGQVPCSGARRQDKVLDVVSATIHGDEVAVNTQFTSLSGETALLGHLVERADLSTEYGLLPMPSIINRIKKLVHTLKLNFIAITS